MLPPQQLQGCFSLQLSLIFHQVCLSLWSFEPGLCLACFVLLHMPVFSFQPSVAHGIIPFSSFFPFSFAVFLFLPGRSSHSSLYIFCPQTRGAPGRRAEDEQLRPSPRSLPPAALPRAGSARCSPAELRRETPAPPWCLRERPLIAGSWDFSLIIAAAHENTSKAPAFGKGQIASNVRCRQSLSASWADSPLQLQMTQKDPAPLHSHQMRSLTFKAERCSPEKPHVNFFPIVLITPFPPGK